MIKTVDQNPSQRFFFNNALISGVLPDSVNNGIAISRQQAKILKLDSLGKIDVLFATDNGLKLRRLNITGIYDTYFLDYDKNIAFINSDEIKRILNLKEAKGNRIEISLKNKSTEEINQISQEIQNHLSLSTYQGKIHNSYQVDKLSSQATSYFAWLSLLDTNIIIIVILMSFIGLFTLISSMIILVIDNISTIGILKSIGMNNINIKNIFLIKGSKIIFLSLILANILSFGFVFLQNEFHFLPLNPVNYYLAWVPVSFNLYQWIIVDICAMIVSYLSMLLPVEIITKIPVTSVIKFN